MKKLVLFILFTCLTSFSFAQIHEIGIFIGGSNFIGDIGRTNYIYPNKISGGLVYKYNLNPRIALRGAYTFLGLNGNDLESGNPYREQRGYTFTNNIHELAIGTEFNFFEYNIRERSTSYTPYIMASLGAFRYKSPGTVNEDKLELKSKTSYSIPVGLGFKGRLSDNLAFAIESSIRFTFVDDIDYSTDSIDSSALNLNFGGSGNDFFVFTGISIVYTFGRPPCYAMPEE